MAGRQQKPNKHPPGSVTAGKAHTNLFWRQYAVAGRSPAETVEAAEVNALTLQPGAGLFMRAMPRAEV